QISTPLCFRPPHAPSFPPRFCGRSKSSTSRTMIVTRRRSPAKWNVPWSPISDENLGHSAHRSSSAEVSDFQKSETSGTSRKSGKFQKSGNSRNSQASQKFRKSQKFQTSGKSGTSQHFDYDTTNRVAQ